MFYLGNIGNHVSSYDSEGHYINLIFYVRNKIYLLQVRTIFLLLFIYFFFIFLFFSQLQNTSIQNIIAILFIFPLMFKTDIFHIMWAHEMIPIIANRCQGRT